MQGVPTEGWFCRMNDKPSRKLYFMTTDSHRNNFQSQPPDLIT